MASLTLGFCCSHLRSEPGDGRSYSVTVFQINKHFLKKKEKIIVVSNVSRSQQRLLQRLTNGRQDIQLEKKDHTLDLTLAKNLLTEQPPETL